MNFNKLSDYINAIENEGAPFFGIKVLYKGDVVFDRIFGSREDGSNADYDDLFFMYSCTKVITAVAAMQLVERGLLDLEAPVFKYIPEFKNMVVGRERIPAKNTLTIRHLMSMTSGYGYHFGEEYLKDCEKNKLKTLDVIKRMAEKNLNFEPGTKFEYGFGLDIIGAVIEVVSGMTYGEYVKKNIFNPLGMDNCYFKADCSIKERILPQYRYNEQTGKFDAEEKRNPFILTENFEAGGAGLIGNINDYVKFIKVLASNGKSDDGFQLIKPETIDLMREDNLNEKVKDFWKPGYSYGLGVRTLIDAESSKSPIGEFGWDSAACAYCLADTKNNLGVVIGCHTLGWGNGYQHHIAIRDLVYECLDI